MKVVNSVSLAVLSLLAPLLGCDKLLNIEEKQYTAGGAGGQGGSSSTEICSFINQKPNSKLSSFRIMNAIPAAGVLDLCVKPSDSNDYGEAWFKANESACGKGVGYTQYTTDLGMDPGTYDIKLVTAGSKCSASGIEGSDIALTENTSTTLLTYGPTFENGKLSVLSNRKPEGLNIPLRFVHALNTDTTLTAGIANNAASPATFIAPIFVDVSLGHVSAESSGGPTSIDDVLADGYTLYGGGENSTDLRLGVAVGNDKNPTLLVPLTVSPGHAYSLFALGVSGSIEQRPKLWTCDENESDGVFLNCGNPVNISFEVFNPNLADAFTSFVAERTGQATKAIVAEKTDVLCVAELFDPKVKELVKTLNSSQFNYRVFSDDIPENERGELPLRQDGNPPQYLPTACPGDLSGLVDTFLQCGIEKGCLGASGGDYLVTEPGDGPPACFTKYCPDEAMAIMTYSDSTGAIPDGQGIACYMCGLTHLASYETTASTHTACTTDSASPAHMAFAGTTGLAVLSKFPLGNPELVLLPSTGWQRAAMRVPVTLPNGTVVDHWCGSVRFPNTEIELPYAGQYGLGNVNTEGVLIEQQYEIQTFIEAVQAQRNATGTLALTGLVAYCGPELTNEQDDTLVYPQAETSYAKLDEVWPRLVAANYTPACTFCGDSTVNPLNAAGATSSFWSTHLFGEGITTDQVVSTERTFMDRTVTMRLDNNSVRTPVSQHFGLRSVVTITQ